jgi:Fe-S-cluster containining protein
VQLPIFNENCEPDAKPTWYASGLRFACTQCGNCCTGGPGYVWISRPEIVRLAEYLKLTPEQTVERYCRKIDGRFSLRETRGAGGLWDCVFLREEESPIENGASEDGAPEDRTAKDRTSHARAAGISTTKDLTPSEPQPQPAAIRQKRRVCGIYPARPQQCRTWPFWDSNLRSRQAWEAAGRHCHGIDRGQVHSLESIEAQRKADESAG